MGASLAKSESMPVYNPRLLSPASGGKSLSRRQIRLEIPGGFPDRYRFSPTPNPWRTFDFPAIPDDDVGIRPRHAALGELPQTPGLGGSRGLSSFTLDPHGDNRIAVNPAPIVLPDCWRP